MTAVLKVYNDTVLASDEGEVTVLILLDYTAAFDTVDHSILLSILEKSFGVTGTALDWIQSFLVGRSQIFQIGPDKSSTVIVFFGLPQGTILGPLFYIVYTADIETIIEKHGVKMHLYADDTQLYDHSRVNNIERSVAALEACLQDIVQWSSQRRFKLNPSKTELIWLDQAHSIGKLQQKPLIRLNSQELSSSPSVRDLGVIIDSGLTLTTHVSILARTCFYQLRRIRQAKKNLDEDSVKTLVHALVLSRLDYCNSVLANLPEVTLAPLICVQHSAARLIRNLRRQDSVSLVMMELHWLPLHHRITFKLCTLMHGIHYGHCPKYMKEMVLPLSTLPGRERFRSAATQNYDIRRVKLKFGERAFAVAAPKAWNSLPDFLKQTNDIVEFKKDLKTRANNLFNLAYN